MKTHSTRVLTPLTLLLLAAALTAPAQSWTNRYNGPPSWDDQATDMAVDSSGNVFVTGYSYGNSSFTDYVTIKYSNAGVALWTNRYNGPANRYDEPTAMAVDSSGNVFVTGRSYFPGISSDYATIAYSSTGVALWTNRYSGPANNSGANAVAVDSSGNVFVTGNSANGTNSDYATLAYSGAGVALWTNRYNGPANEDDLANAVAVDSSGNVFVTGASAQRPGVLDYATIAYSVAGVALWTNRYNGPANEDDMARALAVDGSGNVFVTGSSYFQGSFFDILTIKYSSAGVALWTNRYNGPGNRIDGATAIAVDSSGNVFVTGGSAEFLGHTDYATIKYSNSGAVLWTNHYNGPGNESDSALAIAVDGSGNAFVTGGSSNGTNDDYATIKYSSAGVALWTNRYNGPVNSYDDPAAVAVDSSGNVFVTGYSAGSSGSADYATIKYAAPARPSLGVQRFGNHIVLSWTNAAFGLQSAPAVTGTFTNLPGAISPYTNALSDGHRFFRLAN